MAREIELKIWCDPCMEIDGERVEGLEMEAVTIGNKKPKVIAMCPQHKEDFFDPFVEALQNMGTTVDSLQNSGRVRDSGKHSRQLPAAPPDGSGLQCPVEECAQKGLKNVKSISSHLRSVHDANLYMVIGKDGQLFHDDGRPLTPMPEIRAFERDGEPPNPARVECEEEGCTSGPNGGPAVYEWPTNRKPAQALGVHMAKTHGIKGAGKSGSKQQKVA